ncbi:MAG: sodium:solute symporter [Chitinophagales bacterium]
MNPILILSLIGAYFTLLFVVSWITGRDSSNEAFFIGNKQSPWYVVAFGMIGASLSGATFISIPGVIGNLESINGAFSYMQVVFGYLLGYLVIATVLMPIYYRMNLTSIYTYLEKRFGFWSYKTGAGFFLLSRTIGAAFRVYLVAIVLQLFVFDIYGIHFVFNVLFTLLLIWVYTMRGGIRTIVWTDMLQTTFMLLAVITTILWIGQDLGLTIGGLASAVSESQYSRMFFFDNPNAGNYFFKQFFSGASLAIVMTGLDQDMMQKNNSCKNIGEAQKNMFTFSIVLVFVNILFITLGALLYIYANSKGIELPTKTDHVFPTLALEYFPPMIGVVFLIGLIAAAYSSADSALTALTTSFCVDFLDLEKKAQNPNANHNILKQTRFKVHIGFTFLLLTVVMVFYYMLEQDVISELFRIAGYTYGPLLGLYSFGLFVKNRQVVDKYVPFICVTAPIVCYVLNSHSEAWMNGYKFGFELLILNGLLTFIGLWLISRKEYNTAV